MCFFRDTNSLAILHKSRESVMSWWTYNKNKLFNLQLIIVLLKYVFMRQREEKERSAVGVVTANVRYSLKSLSTSWSMTLYVSLSFIVLTIVRTLVTFFIVLKELVLIMSGSIDSCIFSLSRSKSSFKYISKSVEMHFFVLPLANSIRVDSMSCQDPFG